MLWVGAFFCFNVLQPVYMWSFASISNIVSLGVILILCMNHIKVNRIGLSKISYIILYLVLAFLSGSNFLSFLGCALLPVLMLTDEDYLYKLYDRFITIFVAITTISAIIHILVVVGVPFGYKVIAPLNSLQEVTYRYYPFMVTINSFDYFRFMGMFDEPGAMGTLCGVILLMNKFNLSDKRNIFILTFGFLSFSLFFYIILTSYIIFFASRKTKLYVFFLLVILIFLPKSNLFDQYILARLEFVDGKFAGDDRVVWNFDYVWYERFKQSSDFYWGLGRDAKSIYNSGGSSYVDLLIMYGLVFTIIYSLVFICDAINQIKPRTKNIFIYIIIFFSVMYQRPYINNIGYLMMLYMPIIYLSKDIRFGYERKFE